MESFRASHADKSSLVPEIRILAGDTFSISIDFVVSRWTDTGLTFLVPYFSLLTDNAFQLVKVEVSGTGDAGLVFSKIGFFLRT